jgi:hypothetical protein
MINSMVAKEESYLLVGIVLSISESRKNHLLRHQPDIFCTKKGMVVNNKIYSLCSL